MEQAGCPEMSVTINQRTPRKISGQRRPHILVRLNQVALFKERHLPSFLVNPFSCISMTEEECQC